MGFITWAEQQEIDEMYYEYGYTPVTGYHHPFGESAVKDNEAPILRTSRPALDTTLAAGNTDAKKPNPPQL